MASIYTAKTPSPAVTVSNSAAPSGWKLLSAGVSEDVPRSPTATLSGEHVAVGIPSVAYQLVYFTLTAIESGDIQTEKATALTFSYCNKTIDDAFLVGGALQINRGARGLLAVQYTQQIIALGRRVSSYS